MDIALRRVACPNRREIDSRLLEVMGADGWKVLSAAFDPLAPCLFARNPCGPGLAPDLGPKLLDG
jgi:hypothetical protein